MVGVIVLCIVLILFVLMFLQVFYLKLVGVVLLFWIGVKLMLLEDEGEYVDILGNECLWVVVWMVIVVDFVMSLDNVIVIVGVVQFGDKVYEMVFVVLGLLVLILIIMWGSQLVIKLMECFLVIIIFGVMLLGWIVGSMVVDDFVLYGWVFFLQQFVEMVGYIVGVVGVLIVLVIGQFMKVWQVVVLVVWDVEL